MRMVWRALVMVLLVVVVAGAVKWLQEGERIRHAQAEGWYQMPRGASHLAPDPLALRETAIVQVLAAPAYGWRGYFAIHPWIIFKQAGQSEYTRFEVIGWGARPVVKRNHSHPDGLWYGARPEVLVQHQGHVAQALIPKIQAAIDSYPFALEYRSYPGPNSNTFLAHIGRTVLELQLDLPPTAIGKDYRAWHEPIGLPPSGQGVQVSLGGWLGGIVSPQEGLELNLMGLALGIDLNCPAFRLPFVGRLGMNGSLTHAGCQLGEVAGTGG